jgi:hypothetical protein
MATATWRVVANSSSAPSPRYARRTQACARRRRPPCSPPRWPAAAPARGSAAAPRPASPRKLRRGRALRVRRRLAQGHRRLGRLRGCLRLLGCPTAPSAPPCRGEKPLFTFNCRCPSLPPSPPRARRSATAPPLAPLPSRAARRRPSTAQLTCDRCA